MWILSLTCAFDFVFRSMCFVKLFFVSCALVFSVLVAYHLRKGSSTMKGSLHRDTSICYLASVSAGCGSRGD